METKGMGLNNLFPGRSRILLHFILIVISLGFLAPIFWMIITSLKVPTQVFTWPPVIIPHPIVWKNYPDALIISNFGRYFLNTVFLSVCVILGNLFSCSLAAYGFSRLEWKGRDTVFLIVLSTLILPDQVTMIPLFVIFKKLGMVGNGYMGYLPMILPAWFGRAYFIFMMRQFFMGIHHELSDAARIDGCSDLGILWRIILPLSKPAIIAVALFTLIATWSDFLTPLIYIRDPQYYTISVGLSAFQGRYMTQWNQLMAAAGMMIVPVLIVFIVAQKQFVQGISMTGLK
jgi:multiple sugar transport system permease protein